MVGRVYWLEKHSERKLIMDHRFSGGMHGTRGERTPLLNRNGLRRDDPMANGEQGDLELGDVVPAANVSYVRVISLAKPEAGRLIGGTIALLIASTSSILIPRFGGTIIDIVSGDLQTPEQKSEAVSEVNKTILGILLIVIIGFDALDYLRDYLTRKRGPSRYF